MSGLRSLGILIYPDGSMAEIWDGEVFGVPLNRPYIKRLKQPVPGIPVPPQ